MRLVSMLAPVGLLLWSGVAAAQELTVPQLTVPEPPPAVPDTLHLTPPPPDGLGQVVVRERVAVAVPRERVVVEGEGRDGVRLRIGASAMAGVTLVDSLSGPTFGGEARIGVQFNHLLGVFATPHFVVATFGGGAFNTSGILAITGDADVTFLDHFYVGAGGGFGIVNNPAGPVLHLRAGGYPLVARGENGYRRKGLQIGFDMRNYFLAAPNNTATELTGCIGYEAF
jgi:hypothetical protein